ncbi:acetylxylan esterase [Microbacterium sp. A82]|uniref:acetylxylan esterase n=1 Tax=Microbacterium sp. A82 TaxID=3450452 RepID=UPI003F3B74C8
MAYFDMALPALQEYLPELDEPADLDASWTATLADARRHPTIVSIEQIDTGLAMIDTWDVTFAGYAGDPIRAWYSRPAGVTGTLPAVVEYLGYGRGRGLAHERITWAAAGYAHLLMDSRGQGGQYGSGGATADPHGAAPAAPGFLTRGILDTETHYYRRLITDAVRAVDAVRALPGIDGSRVTLVGNSQGGGLALAAAGLSDSLAGLIASVPFLCHPARALEITEQHPWGEVLQFLSVQRGAEAEVMRTLSYVDAASLGRRSDAPALFAVGLRDSICPPSTVFAAFNHYGSLSGNEPEKQIEVYPHNHHEGGDAHFVRRSLAAVAQWAPSPLSAAAALATAR